MAVNRISKIKIKERGLFTAIYGNVNQDEFFVDDDLKKYNLWSQLYSYLKGEGYEMVLFYDTTNNFHSFSQTDLIKFLGLTINTTPSSAVIQKEKYVARHIKSPFRSQRINQTEKPNSSQPSDNSSLHRSIKPVTVPDIALPLSYYRSSVDFNLLDYFKINFNSTVNRGRVALIIKFPDTSRFEENDSYLNFFQDLNLNNQITESESKIIIVYGCNNSESLIEKLNRNNNYLFVNNYFKTLFLNVESDSYRVKHETTFELALPDQVELRNWLNRKRFMKGIHPFNSIPFDKITLRFLQERKRLSELEMYDVPKFIREISTKSGWDRLHELIGLENVKSKINEVVKFTKYKRQNNSTSNYPAHLVFLGNPGTGKTTVASIVAEIFKEEGVIPIGQYIETKAADLLGTEIGTAAKLINEKCEAATGGVLFIDETASFIDEATKAYGLLAIKTLLTWLENPIWNSKTIVIFAGYPDDIENLFSKSDAGLRGRFSSENYLQFDNYNSSQLTTILASNVRKEKLTISDEAIKLVEKIFETLIRNNSRNKEWDNARRARDVFNILFKNAVLRNSTTIDKEDIPIGLSSIVKGKSVSDIKETPEYVELNNLIGLQNVKSSINDLIDSVEQEQYYIENGLQIEKSIQPLHLVFSGAPGTGKTTVARLFGGLLKNLGILSNGKVIEVDKGKLTKGHVGGTEERVADVLDKSMGNVLFIDEAYQLAGNDLHGIDYGKDAIEAILKRMEDDRDKFCVIAAGYTEEMAQFLDSNSGLKSRFHSTIIFYEYSIDELIEIFRSYCNSKGIIYNVIHDCIISQYMTLLQSREGRKFGNAREARKLFDDTLRKQQKRLNNKRKKSNLSNEQISNLMKSFVTKDIEEAILFLNSDLHPQIDFNCSLGIVQQPDIPVSIKNEPIVVPEEKHVEPERKSEGNPSPPKELEASVKELLYDYCIIDTNIWMNENQIYRKHNLNSIRVLMNLYKLYEKNLIAHGKTYEELKRIKENKEGKYPKEVSIAASDGFRLLSDANEKNLIAIPELAGEHDRKAYADLAIYEYASNTYKSKNTVALISNDKDCRIRVRSVLQGYKSEIDFKFIRANELKRYTDLIFYTDWYKNLFPKK